MSLAPSASRNCTIACRTKSWSSARSTVVDIRSTSESLAKSRSVLLGYGLPGGLGGLVHLCCCPHSRHVNNLKPDFGERPTILAGFSPAKGAAQRHWTNQEIFGNGGLCHIRRYPWP